MSKGKLLPHNDEDYNFFKISIETKPTFYTESEVKTKKTIQDLDLRRFSISNRSYHDLVLKLIKIKETRNLGKVKKPVKGNYKIMSLKMLTRTLSIDTDLELEFESLTNVRKRKNLYKIEDINIVKDIPEKPKEIHHQPLLFQTIIDNEPLVGPNEETEPIESSHDEARGVIKYKLSDRTFIDKGWTVLPIEKVVRKMNIYRVYPAHPEFNWFAHNKGKAPMTYDTGEKLAAVDDSGRGRWFYKNGRVALDYHDTEEENCQQRFVVYSSGEPDEKGRFRPVTLLAMFDYLGNGVVFDHVGKIRLKYNQSEGVVLDRAIGPVSRWKWHSLNDPPVLQRVMMETYMDPEEPKISKLKDRDPRSVRPDDIDILTIEFENCIKEQEKKKAQKFQPYQIKMKALKINEQFSLRIIDQANVYLTFNTGSANLKLNLGMVVDNREILSTETEDAGDFSNSLDKVRNQTDSVIELQQKLENVRKLERARINHEQKIRPTMSVASIDHMNSAISKPLYTLRTVKSLPTNNIEKERTCRRKPACGNLYYNTRLI